METSYKHPTQLIAIEHTTKPWLYSYPWADTHHNMTVWILARNDINVSMAAGLIRLHMPGVK